MYTEKDMLLARKSLLGAAGWMAAVLAVLLAGYVAALVKGWYVLTAVLAVLMLAFCLFFGDLMLAPRLRYARFLKELGKGLRRSADCVLECMDDGLQLQDGVKVHALQVRLPDGDSRIYYLNASKLDFLPEMEKRIRLVSYGRHVVDFVVI